MRVTLFKENGEVHLPIPEEVMSFLGWVEGDELKIDVSATTDTLIIYKEGDPKTLEAQRVGDELI